MENLSKGLNWLKLTHRGAVSGQIRTGNKEIMGTYQLHPLTRKPTFEEETHFYWMSGSQFREAIKFYPQLKKAHHSCGPGHTYESICEVLGKDSGAVDIFLSLEEWEEALK